MIGESKFHHLEDDDDEEEEASWQDSYSDLMTDLLAIFVILFSFAMMSQAASAISAKTAREQNTAPMTESVVILPSQNGLLPSQNSVPVKKEEFNELYENIKAYIEEAGLSEQLSVTKQGEVQILLRVADSVFFDSGKADIHEAAKPLLGKISEILTEYEASINIIRIEGHTDNRPINTREFASNWELSTSRAVNVLRRILEISGLEPKKLSAVGYSEFYPVAENDSDSGRAKNRRVDFFIEAVSTDASTLQNENLEKVNP